MDEAETGAGGNELRDGDRGGGGGAAREIVEIEGTIDGSGGGQRLRADETKVTTVCTSMGEREAGSREEQCR